VIGATAHRDFVLETTTPEFRVTEQRALCKQAKQQMGRCSELGSSKGSIKSEEQKSETRRIIADPQQRYCMSATRRRSLVRHHASRHCRCEPPYHLQNHLQEKARTHKKAMLSMDEEDNNTQTVS